MDPARQLLQRYVDEIASAADLAELARLLPQRPDLADELAWAAHTEALLESHFSERRTLNVVAALLEQNGPPLRGGAATEKTRCQSSPPPRGGAATEKTRHGAAGHLKWCAAAVLLITTGVLFGFWIGRSQPGPGAVVSGRVRIDGVEVVRIPDDSWIEVVGDDSAVIRLPDGSRAELAPASAAVLRQITRWSRKVVELDRGRAAFHVEKGRNRFRVNTPLGSVSAQDAEFCVELQTEEEEGEEPLNKQSTLVLVVAALVGQVEVDSGGQRYVLAAGQKQSFADKSAAGKKKPAFSGTIVEASAASLTVESPANKKGGEAVRKQFKLTAKTEFEYFGVAKEGEKPTVGYQAAVWLAEGSDDALSRVQLGLKPVILDGKVAAVAADAKSFTLERAGKGGTISTELKIAEGAKLVYKDADKGDKPTAGYFARVWMKPGSQDVATGVVFSSKSIVDDKKSKTGKFKKPTLSGTVKALAADGKSFTLEFARDKRGETAAPLDIRLAENAVITARKEAAKLQVGQTVTVVLEEGKTKVAESVQIIPPQEKAEGKSTVIDGKVAAVAADGKSFTLERPGKDGTPIRTEFKIAEGVKVAYHDADKGDKPTVGYFVRVVLTGKGLEVPAKIVFSSKKLDAPGEKKKPGKTAALSGTVKALAADGKSFTLALPKTKSGDEPKPIDILISENTKVLNGKEEGKLAVGQPVSVVLQEGAAKTAESVLIGKPSDPTGKKPGAKGKQSSDLEGVVAAVAADAKSFTLERPGKDGTPIRTEIKIVEDAKVVYMDLDKREKPTVGYFVRVFLERKNQDAPTKIVFSGKKFTDAPAEKKKPGKNAALSGTVKALAADGKSFTLLPPRSKKDAEPTPINILLSENTKITTGKEAAKLAVGQTVTVWLEEGSTNSAATVQVGPAEAEKPKPEKGKKPSPNENEKKPEAAKKPKEPAKPPRDPAPTAAVIDAEIDKRMAADKIPASPQAGDAEFLRRVTLDLTGRIPSYRETVAFLDSTDPAKRRKLVDELLDSTAYGEHFGTIWRNLIVPRNTGGKSPADIFTPWLAEQFNDNRGWNAIVADLLNVSGPINNNPAAAFMMANSENFHPQPRMVAGATARLFWGVNLRCAECHSHPFANWNQDDFWGTAAFFGKLQFTGFKGGPAILTEALPEETNAKGKKVSRPTAMRGSAIQVPDGAGKAAGRLVKARFLGGAEPALDEKEPFRPSFTAWATGADNPYFARAAVNRMWAHFFGRGFVHPLDGVNESNPPSHPELLRRLASEFASSGFDLKHLARCIAMSKAYQRTSRSMPGNEADATAFSHASLKVLTPEVIFESLAVVMTPDKNEKSIPAGKKGQKGGKKFGGGLGVSREAFVASFRTGEEPDPLDYTQGIPQHLRLMNAAMLNRGASVVDTLSRSEASQTEAINALYLTALSRRPTAEETRLMSGYLSRRKDAREGYSGVLWILLNSSEFALNR